MMIFTMFLDLGLFFSFRSGIVIIVGGGLLLCDICTYLWCKKNEKNFQNVNHLSKAVACMSLSGELLVLSLKIMVDSGDMRAAYGFLIGYVFCVVAVLLLSAKREENREEKSAKGRAGVIAGICGIGIAGILSRRMDQTGMLLILAWCLFLISLVFAVGYSHLVYWCKRKY